MTDSSANRTPKKAALIITQPDKRKTHKESAESDSAFRKMAAKSRQQIYDLANPEKQLLKQFSSAGMAKEAYANLMQPWEAINQNAVNALSVNPMVAHVNSVLEETINQNAANVLGMNTTAAAYADSVLQEAINQSAAISTLNTTTDALKVLDAFNAGLYVDSVSVEAFAKKIGTIPSFKELSVTVGFDSAEALAEKINSKAFDVTALGMATLPQPDYFAPELMKSYDDSAVGWTERLSLTSCNSFLPIANSKEDREAAENEELNRRFRESGQRMWEMREQQERRQKEIAKQAYLEALREHEAEKQAKEEALRRLDAERQDKLTSHQALDVSNGGEVEASAAETVEDGDIYSRRKAHFETLSIDLDQHPDEIYKQVIITENKVWYKQRQVKGATEAFIELSAFDRDFLQKYYKDAGKERIKGARPKAK